MDYKELIKYLHGTARCCDGCYACEQAATAIEMLLAERDAAVKDLHILAPCLSCTQNSSNNSGKMCKYAGNCNGKHWKWRGQKKECDL